MLLFESFEGWLGELVGFFFFGFVEKRDRILSVCDSLLVWCLCV